METKGKIIQIIGPVVDVEFPEGTSLPEIYNALETKVFRKIIIPLSALYFYLTIRPEILALCYRTTMTPQDRKKRWANTPKGRASLKAAHARYLKSEKGKAWRSRYNKSEERKAPEDRRGIC